MLSLPIPNIDAFQFNQNSYAKYITSKKTISSSILKHWGMRVFLKDKS